MLAEIPSSVPPEPDVPVSLEVCATSPLIDKPSTGEAATYN
jgi:hypothetical protein